MADNKLVLVIGNGNSARQLAKLGFENIPNHIDTFGMGLAYRLYETQNWWPTYYACCDSKVVHSNREEFARLLEDPAVTCNRFYFPIEIVDSPQLSVIPHSSTGDFCVLESVRAGYKFILYIGMDRDYQEIIPEARPLTDYEFVTMGYEELLRDTDPNKVGRELLIIERDPTINTNYFFDSYQRKGDVYSLPKVATSHNKAWDKLYSAVARSDATICDLSSAKDGYPKFSVTLQDVFELSEMELIDRVSQYRRRQKRNIGRSLLNRWFPMATE